MGVCEDLAGDRANINGQLESKDEQISDLAGSMTGLLGTLTASDPTAPTTNPSTSDGLNAYKALCDSRKSMADSLLSMLTSKGYLQNDRASLQTTLNGIIADQVANNCPL